MDPTQVQRLKLNINNIKSVLTESTGDLKDAKKKKRAVIRAKIDEEKRLAAEKKLEKKSSPLASIGKTIGKAAGSVKDAFGKVIEFGALVLFGNLVSKLPEFEEQWKEFVEKYKPLFEKLGQFLVGIRDAVTGMIDAFVAEPFAENDFAQFDEDNKLIDGKLKEIDDAIIEIQKIFDAIGITDLAKKLIGYKDSTPDNTIKDAESLLSGEATGGDNNLEEQQKLATGESYKSGDLKTVLNSSLGVSRSFSSTSQSSSVSLESSSSSDVSSDDSLSFDFNTDFALGIGQDIAPLYTNLDSSMFSDKIEKTRMNDFNFNMGDLLINNSSSVSANNERRFSTLNNSAFTDDSVTVYVGTQVVEKIVPVA